MFLFHKSACPFFSRNAPQSHPLVGAQHVGMGDVRASSFAPRISFVRAPRKWERNANWDTKEVVTAAGAGDDIGQSEGGGAESKPKVPVDGRKMKDALEGWMDRSNLQRAPEAHYLKVETLRDMFEHDRSADGREDDGLEPSSSETSEKLNIKTFGSLFGIVLARKFTGEQKIARRRDCIGVTCDTRHATPLINPSLMSRFEQAGIEESETSKETRLEARRNASKKKKEMKQKLDPARSRKFSKDDSNAETIRSHSRYMTELLKMSSGSELVRLRLFPDAKELTESFAANNAARSFLYPQKCLGSLKCGVDPSDSSVTCVAIGDGTTPRTAALFAFLTKWHCVAIDPMMVDWDTWRLQKKIEDEGENSSSQETINDTSGNLTSNWGGVHRLVAYRKKIQEVRVECEKAVLVLVHAHVSLQECLAQVRTRSGRCSAVILPCCNWYAKLVHPDGQAPIAEYDDMCVSSPQRMVRVFDDLPCGKLDGVSSHEMKGMEMNGDVVCLEV